MRAATGARPVRCAASGPVGRYCTFYRDPLSEDPRDYAEIPRRSTALKSSHVQTGPLCTWKRITVTSTIRTSPGITRKTRHRPARALLSYVQYPRNRPENNPARPMRTPSETLTWKLGPTRTFTGNHDPPTWPTSSLHQGGLSHRAFLTRRLPSPRASTPGE